MQQERPEKHVNTLLDMLGGSTRKQSADRALEMF